jgi:hypothetical protein
MPLVDQELQEFEAVLARMDEAELAQELVFEDYLKRGKQAEAAMIKYYRSCGWSVIPGWAHGPDAVAWKTGNTGALEMRILDNKSGGRKGVITGASGLSGRSLRKTLERFIKALDEKPAKSLPRAVEARKLLEETRQAVSLAGRNLPSGVTLWVTNACGAATGVRIFRYPLEADVNAPVIRFDNIRAHIDPKDCATTTSSS